MRTVDGVSTIDGLAKQAAEQRARRSTGRRVIGREDVEVEHGSLGTARWYLSPMTKDVPHNAVSFFELELKPGEQSGTLVHPGSMIWFVVEGQGKTRSSMGEYEWSPNDVLLLPPMPEGVQLQHENTGDVLARLVCCYPNFADSLGYDVGAILDVNPAD